MIDDKHIQAFKEARKIHSPQEMIEIQGHSAYEWTGFYSPLNELTVEQLVGLLEGDPHESI